jgi:hypothetical protein
MTIASSLASGRDKQPAAVTWMRLRFYTSHVVSCYDDFGEAAKALMVSR